MSAFARLARVVYTGTTKQRAQSLPENQPFLLRVTRVDDQLVVWNVIDDTEIVDRAVEAHVKKISNQVTTMRGVR